MTFIQPQKEFNIWNGLVMVLLILSVGGTFALVALYNNVVNIQGNIAALKTKLDTQGAANTDLQNRIVATLGSDAVAQAAQNDGLVQDAHPEYMTVANNQSLSLK
jgi:cell division protein FtsL